MSIFSQIKVPEIKLNSFDLSHEIKTTTQFGRLTPIGCFEVNPGETHQIETNMFLRLQPMLAPVMHEVNAYVHWFFVPNRLIWNEWEDFITGGEDGTLTPVTPSVYFTTANATTANQSILKNSTLADYLGLPQLSTTTDSVGEYCRFSLLPFRAYQLIYNEYYLDQNVDDKFEFSLDGGNYTINQDITQLMTIRYRSWEKDYFTSALPWTQRGEAAGLSLAGEAPVVAVGGSVGNPTWVGVQGASPVSDGYITQLNGVNTKINTPTSTSGSVVMYDPKGTLKADLTNISPVTINQLRMAYSLQRWLEASAVGGSRYIEQILTHFGVKSSDARLQRPEYLGGNRLPIMISEVLQNSATTSDSPQGNMAGHGMSAGNDFSFKRFFEEHGFIIGILSVMPRTSYQQGVSRMWTREDKFDYFFPEFAELGEQEVKLQELYGSIHRSQAEKTFGYQSRYAEYKYMPNRVSGEFKTSLNDWHLGRIFSEAPTLSPEFIHVNPANLNRIFNVTDTDVDNILCDIYLDYKALRPMPYFGKPAW